MGHPSMETTTKTQAWQHVTAFLRDAWRFVPALLFCMTVGALPLANLLHQRAMHERIFGGSPGMAEGSEQPTGPEPRLDLLPIPHDAVHELSVQTQLGFYATNNELNELIRQSVETCLSMSDSSAESLRITVAGRGRLDGLHLTSMEPSNLFTDDQRQCLDDAIKSAGKHFALEIVATVRVKSASAR
jgi:hypothetical protein